MINYSSRIATRFICNALHSIISCACRRNFMAIIQPAPSSALHLTRSWIREFANKLLDAILINFFPFHAFACRCNSRTTGIIAILVGGLRINPERGSVFEGEYLDWIKINSIKGRMFNLLPNINYISKCRCNGSIASSRAICRRVA